MTVSTPATHNTVETRFVKAGRIAFAYRRFGLTAENPLVMLQHFRGNLDNCDPALTDAIAVERDVTPRCATAASARRRRWPRSSHRASP